jgi:hypothetical protein
MGYSRHLIDVLVDEGFEWTLVASHHISRTSPSYNDKANPEGNFNIKSSPPNRAQPGQCRMECRAVRLPVASCEIRQSGDGRGKENVRRAVG